MVRRVEVHDDFGGGRQGGIAPSRRSPNLLIFSDPDVGGQHGYHDRWEDGIYHYVGEGQVGDQTMTRGNAAILNHARDGRALRLFWGVRGMVQYAGEFELDAVEPWYFDRARETGSEAQRDVITFRLVPMGDVESLSEDPSGARRFIKPRPAALSQPYREARESVVSTPRDPFEVDPDVVDRALIGHATTQNELARIASLHGYLPLSPSSSDPDFDLAWRTIDGCTVVEVKSLTNANESKQLRLGLGQVLDYAHRLGRDRSSVRPVLAVEHQPLDISWVDICENVGVLIVWPGTFELAM